VGTATIDARGVAVGTGVAVGVGVGVGVAVGLGVAVDGAVWSRVGVGLPHAATVAITRTAAARGAIKRRW
jgi:hypothetical protein